MSTVDEAHKHAADDTVAFGDRGSTKEAADPESDSLGFDSSAPLLEVQDLQVEFRTREGVAHAVNGATFGVGEGETLGILGESGSGKSVTAQAIMGILDSPPARISGGKVILRGVDLLTLPDEARRKVRTDRVAIVFQDALSALNPVFTVGYQLGELFRIRRGVSRQEAKTEATAMLDLVGIPGAAQRVNDYPHQFSGGMRQRVMIAMALINNPDLLIADEPTTALDVTTQAQIISLMQRLQRDFGSAIILITHDLGVVAETADEVMVMYAGRAVERADYKGLFYEPHHPYTWGLMDSMPTLSGEDTELTPIPGTPPSLLRPPEGCKFNPRCRFVMDICRTEEPELKEVPGSPAHVERCHLDEAVKQAEIERIATERLGAVS